ncbi:MAG: hypothetical protein WBW84_15480 [Acidobacteriaceae bacterium]
MVAALMIAFGVAEVITAFRHSFFGLHTEKSVGSIVAGSAVGFLYAAAGALVIRQRRSGLVAALICLALDVAGRVAMVVFGFFPVAALTQLAGMLAGTLIVIGFGAYLWSRRRHFI